MLLDMDTSDILSLIVRWLRTSQLAWNTGLKLKTDLLEALFWNLMEWPRDECIDLSLNWSFNYSFHCSY